MTVTSTRNAALVCWAIGSNVLVLSRGRKRKDFHLSQTQPDCIVRKVGASPAPTVQRLSRRTLALASQLWLLVIEHRALIQIGHNFFSYRAFVKSREERFLPRPAEHVSSLASIGMRSSLVPGTKGELSSLSTSCPAAHLSLSYLGPSPMLSTAT